MNHLYLLMEVILINELHRWNLHFTSKSEKNWLKLWRNDDQRSSRIEDKEERAKLNYLNHAILTLIHKRTFKKIRVLVPYWKNNPVNPNHKSSLTPLNEPQSDCSRKLHQLLLSPPWRLSQDDLSLLNFPISVSQKGSFKSQWRISI